MKRAFVPLALVASILPGAVAPKIAGGQPPGYGSGERGKTIGFIEKFALADDREKSLQDLIPGSHDYFYYHILHDQNTGRIAEAQAKLEQWSALPNVPPTYQKLLARQQILGYAANPQQALEYLRLEMGLSLGHAPPQADRAADLPTALDPSIHDPKRLIQQALLHDASLASVSDFGLLALLELDLPIDKLRIVLQRLQRIDSPTLIPQLIKELRADNTPGWGAYPIHAQLTLEQRNVLVRQIPQLLENDNFVRQYLLRLLPSDDAAAHSDTERRAHLQRLEDFTATLPSSQNTLKAVVLYQRLRLDLSEEKFDLARFERYLALPRNQFYCNQEFLRANANIPRIDFGASYDAETRCPPIVEDSTLIRRYLEHFLQRDEKIDRFAKWLDRGFLEQVLIETKILYGLGNSGPWYQKLSPENQKELRDRVELKFAPISKSLYQSDEPVQLVLDVKNVPKLIVRVYQLNPRNIYRKHSKTASTDIDLDGLVANAEQTLEYTVPGDRRHREVIAMPQCAGKGTWVIDLLGGGLRSRALLQKGQLRSAQRLTDAGHEFRIYDESGNPVPTATIEMGTRTFRPDDDGRILIPYGESDQSVPILLVDDAVASVEKFLHRRESYQLQLGLLIDAQNLISGAKGSLIARPQLLCNGQPTSIKTLEDAMLTIVTTDLDGIQSTLAIPNVALEDDEELIQQFLVPQRLRDVQVTLSGKMLAVSRNSKESLAASQNLSVNEISASTQIADFYLINDVEGYRLQVRGRNGEPVAKLPVTVQLQVDGMQSDSSALLATDNDGQVKLGSLNHVASLRASANGLANRSFGLRQSLAQWPSQLSVVAGDPLEFPWTTHRTDNAALSTACSLLEVRGGLVVADWQSKLSVENGRLKIAPLEPGSYFLTHHRNGDVTVIRSARGKQHHGFLLGNSKTIEDSPPTPASIAKTETRDGKLRVQVSGADEGTRIHWIATSFELDNAFASRMLLSPGLQFRQPYATNLSFYVDSLKLDEEYQYILQRQYATKYPGNLLPQPSLLLNPWDTAETQNQRRDAAAGDAPPPSAATPATADGLHAMDRAGLPGKPEQQRKCTFEFLGKPAILMANRRPDADGWIEFPLEGLKGYHNLTAVVVSDSGITSHAVALPATEIPIADLRLAKAFAADQHLAQLQRAQLLNAGVKTDLGDARSTRIQIYSSMADVYRLYSTLSPSPALEKFRILTRWNQLKDEEKSRTYSELACHEMHLFLYLKDRDFFDRVIAPYLDDKYEKQLVDRYLVNQGLETYLEPWQRHRLNTMERILLADRLADARSGNRKWIGDAVGASPISPEERSQTFLAAISAASLDINAAGSTLLFSQTPRILIPEEERLAEDLKRSGASLGDIPYAFGKEADKNLAVAADAEMEELSLGVNGPMGGGGMGGMAGGGRGSGGPGGTGGKPSGESRAGERAKKESRRGLLGRKMMYMSLDTTREWAENQFYRTRIQQQNHQLIPPGPLWKELADRDSISQFLSTEFHLSHHTLSEMLAVMALLDLPFEAPAIAMAIENDHLVVTSPSNSIAFLESIATIPSSATATNILVGQETYLVSPGADADAQKPLTGQSLVRGIGYRTNVVVTNPGNSPQMVSVLTQIPQGAIPLEGGKRANSKSLRLEPYTTQQITYAYYFPTAGEFQHYGAQVSIDGQFAAGAASKPIRVLDAPEDQNKDSWGYIALWGTNDQVLDVLRKRNVQQLQLDLIAFRMQDKPFYEACLRELENQGLYHPVLWAYSVRHNDPPRIQQLIAFRPDWAEKLGPIFQSPIAAIDTAHRYEFEHLDFRPLVQARTHLLGSERVILNDRLAAQYSSLLERIAYQPQLHPAERMAVAYYMLLQNRIDDAIGHFDRIVPDSIPMRIQYDYMDAYLDFYRARYDRAAQIAGRYANHGVARWRDLFAQIRLQIEQRAAMIDGRPIPGADPKSADVTDPIQRMLVDARGSQQDALASETPSLDLNLQDGRLFLTCQNLERVDVRYYLMDIELLFSRNPFIQQEGSAMLAIQPNRTEALEIQGGRGKREMVLPGDYANRNVVVEVSSGALTRSRVVVSNAMDIALAEAFGRLQATTGNGKPMERAYVKVYARHRDGSVRFYKDGYTDLRGQFDYASLSTNDLQTVDRFAILVLDPDQGAWVREATPPSTPAP